MRGRDVRPWLGAIAPAVASIAVVGLLLGSTHPAPRLALAFALGLAAAATAAVFSVRPWLRRLGAWRERLDVASRRLAELESAGGGASGGLPEDWIDLVAPLTEDPRLDEALGDLAAALQDEERLRERRETRGDDARELVRRARDLATATEGSEEPVAARLGVLLDALERNAVSVREALQTALPQAIAADEVAALLHEHVTSGHEALRRAVDGSAEAEQRLETLDGLTRRLETRSREIGQVLIVLNDITEQANLLALNAAIIAAQAGEEGKGFGVVADEMRNLSERASSSTKETEILAQTLRDDVAQAVRGLVETRDVVRGVKGGVSRTSESHGTIAELAKRSRAAAREGMAAAERQASELRDLSGRVPALREERLRLERLERESIRPARRTLTEIADRLEAQAQLLTVRDSLRTRLESAVRAVREHRGQERSHRALWEENARQFRESGRRVLDALEEGRRRDHLVRDVARDVRELAGSADR